MRNPKEMTIKELEKERMSIMPISEILARGDLRRTEITIELLKKYEVKNNYGKSQSRKNERDKKF